MDDQSPAVAVIFTERRMTIVGERDCDLVSANGVPFALVIPIGRNGFATHLTDGKRVGELLARSFTYAGAHSLATEYATANGIGR